ncbi:MAG: hypothetical protein ACXVBE_05345, partial [Bdellovibrionota bacterium]
MKKIIVSTLVIFLVLLAGFFFRGKQDKPTDGFGSSATFTPTGIAQTAKSNLTAQSPAANAISNTDRNTNLTHEWISSEAHAMNRSFPNAKAADSARKKL